MQNDKTLEKAMEVGIGMSGGVKVYSTTMPSMNEDLEEGVHDLNYHLTRDAMRVISWDDYQKRK